ncbi:hypothetical protein GCM10025858_34750 [Alicyclobacillus sacchari]|uniref:hypothetical protein n=1 Tax=Alicyclobacillus sacchari TaxID=392010 RepID=UPI0023E9E8D0|nr:hypothetical protein [Alicyclobacillus sacchari]GMA58972.1 hypothetical protein GCM10025858_34750 [Alicyclobacillus sacchari]
MDNPPIGSSGRVDRALEPTQQVRPTPRLPVDRTDERIAQAPAHAPANALTEAELARLDDALFSLEQHVPYQLLQNPLWLKAEWAWKVLLVQHMFTSAAAAANSPLKQQQTLPVVNEPAIAQNEHAVRMPGTADEASESEQPGNFERVIQGLWSILTEASEPVASSKLVSLRMQTDPPLLHFASVGNEIFAQAHSTADRRQIERWTLQDRLTAAVIDNPYERYGAGLFFARSRKAPLSSCQMGG